MQYIYKVMVNWVYKPSSIFLLPHFHEWKQEDEIFHYPQVPVIKVSENLYNLFIHNNDFFVPSEFLEVLFEIKIEVGQEFTFIIVSPFFDSLAIKLIGNEIHSKSRLSPTHEQFIYKLTEENDCFEFEIPIPKEIKTDFKSNFFLGLTRNEKEKKLFIKEKLYSAYKNKEKGKLSFILSELSNEDFSTIIKLPPKKIMNKIISFLEYGWFDKHEAIYNYFMIWSKKTP